MLGSHMTIAAIKIPVPIPKDGIKGRLL